MKKWEKTGKRQQNTLTKEADYAKIAVKQIHKERIHGNKKNGKLRTKEAEGLDNNDFDRIEYPLFCVPGSGWFQ